jgi:hypothetical protein
VAKEGRGRKTKMKRPDWNFKGIISQGDADGPVCLFEAMVNRKKVEKLVPMWRKPVFIVDGERFATLISALEATRCQR